jgi:hypothetical protein
LSIFKMYFFTTAETSRAMFVYQSERRPCTLRRCPAGCQRVLPSRNKVPSKVSFVPSKVPGTPSIK